METENTKHTTRWYQNLWAALIFFTRLPFWRIYQPPKESYSALVEYWPLAGWITGGIMAAVLYVGSLFLPWLVTVVLAIAVRMLVTGALHEDGLADFFDGFGGGSNRDRILAIMKDSHIGTYGVLGLVIYVLLLGSSLFCLAPTVAALAVFAADPFAKMASSQLVMMLPYARREEESKNKTVYRKFSMPAAIGLFLQGLLPVLPLLILTEITWYYVIVIPYVIMYFLYLFIRRRLGGYTGDCCGAVCLLVELSVYVIAASLMFRG